MHINFVLYIKFSYSLYLRPANFFFHLTLFFIFDSIIFQFGTNSKKKKCLINTNNAPVRSSVGTYTVHCGTNA